ncbi:MAG: metal ABC transporter substrate-binding protein [Verrucomicrobiota bacterium]
MCKCNRNIRLILWIVVLCFAQASFATQAKPLKILASFYPMYVMTLNVVGDTPDVSVECMTEPITGCLHDYQLTPANLKTLAGSDVFVANGAGMETFLEKAVRQAPQLKVIEASRGIKRAFEDNPHVWVSIGGAMEETRNIADGLAAADPAHAAIYAEKAARYIARLDALRQEMHAALDGLKHRDIITFHEAFPYFASEFHLKIVGVVEREPGSEPNAGELAHTISMVRENKVKALFAEPQYPAKSARIIERETGVPVSILDPAVTGPREPAKARDSYINAMENNKKALIKALGDPQTKTRENSNRSS